MSNVLLNSSHTIPWQGGENYQFRKRTKTINLLFLTDCQGIPLACSSSMAGYPTPDIVQPLLNRVFLFSSVFKLMRFLKSQSRMESFKIVMHIPLLQFLVEFLYGFKPM